jgi:hypothetical protein
MCALHDGAYGFEGLRFIDIACPDFYPIRDSTSDVTGTALYAMDCREVLFGSDPTTCVIAIPQLFAFGGPWGPGVEPTYRQVRAEVYAAIVGGAKGVWYYAYYTSGGMKAGMPLNPKRNHWFLPESNLWASIGELNSELQGFKEVILFGKPCSKVTVSSKSGVLFRAISLHDKTYLFVVNPASEARSNLRVRMPAAWDKATPLCGSPALRKQGRSWRFDLSGYEVGIYRIGSSAD